MEGKRLYCIRGAVCTANEKSAIMSDVGNLFNTICEKNGFEAKDMVSIQFTMTGDLDEMNAASALRASNTNLDVSTVPLFCAQEPNVKGMMDHVIRIMVSVYMAEDSKVHNVYINGAESLRPDFVGK